ncbi:MAG: flagellin [bacterium]|nr:flagellin [bacterium]
MSLRINTNISALNARHALNTNGQDLNKRIERLSSGLKVNRAADDAAGLSISEGLRAEASGFSQGIRNSEQAINLIQTAEGALGEVSGVLLRMRELAVQSASSTVSDENRQSIHAEFAQLTNEIDRIASVTSYNNTSILSGYGNTVNQNAASSTALASTTTGVINVQLSSAAAGSYAFSDAGGDGQITMGNGVVTQTLNVQQPFDIDGAGNVVATGTALVANFDRLGVALTLSGARGAEGVNPATDGYRDGDLGTSILRIDPGAGGTFQIGPDQGAINRLEASVGDMRASGAKLNLSGVSLASLPSSQTAISSLDSAIQQVNRTRGELGSIQNRLSFNIRASGVMLENGTASDANIRDADVAAEVSAFSRAQVLTQSGLAMFSQANISATSVLSLLT